MKELNIMKNLLFTLALLVSFNSFGQTAEDYIDRAESKYDAGDFYGAIADYTKVIELEPSESSEIYLEIGIIKDELNDQYGAIADFSKAIELDPNNYEAYYEIGLTKYVLEDFKGALADINFYLGLNLPLPGPYIYYVRGDIKAELNDQYGAIADFSKAIELDPNYADAFLLRGLSKYELGDTRGCCSDFIKASKLGNKYATDLYSKLCK